VYQIEDQGVDIASIVKAVEAVQSQLSPDELAKLSYHIDAPEWRTWSNPEFLISHKGLRLDEVSTSIRNSILDILKTISAMRINGFLGELVKGEKVCNEYSYNFVVFGKPSADRPWGFQFYGHHLCLNIFFYKGQMVVAPWFTGAEPNEIDSGKYKGTTILKKEEALGLKLMQSLSPELQQKARLFEEMHDSKMPPGRWNQDDQRHLCGAYRDNRLVPYEGIRFNEMSKEQQALVEAIVDEYLLFLPKQAREKQLKHALSFPEETYFCWIGGFGNEDPFYYRIQSPSIIVEFDHHSGVFLNNKEPAKFHVHTLLRLPNAGDYGHAIKRLAPPPEDMFVWDGK
jgi:hypothetical protein